VLIWICGIAAAKPFTDEDLVAIRDRVAPLVEQATGKRFAPVPPIEVLSDAEFARRLAAESQGLAYLFHPDVTPELLGLVSIGSRALAPYVVGKYALFEHELEVTSGGFVRTSQALAEKGTPVEPDVLATCVVAHELTHALQAQSGAFERVASSRDAEWFGALNAVAEGQAAVVAREVCDELGYGQANPAIEALLGITGDPPSVYRYGVDFATVHPDMWAVLADPPWDMEALLFPDRYRPEPPPTCPWADRLGAAMAPLTSAPDPIHRLGYLSVLEKVGDSPEHRAIVDRRVASWGISAGVGLGSIAIERVDFADESSATAFAAALSAHAAVRPSEDRGSAIYQLSEAVEGWAGVWRSRVDVRNPAMPALSATITQVWSVRGPSVGIATLLQVKRADKVVVPALLQALASE
jgi:hypothetical protein